MASHAGRKSRRGITTVSALSWLPFDRASVIRMPRSSMRTKPVPVPSSCQSSPTSSDAAQRGTEAQREERGVPAADVLLDLEDRQQVAHVRGQEGRGLPLDLDQGLDARDAAPGHGDDPVLAVEGVAGVAVRQRHGGERLVDGGARQRLPAVDAVGEGGQTMPRSSPATPARPGGRASRTRRRTRATSGRRPRGCARSRASAVVLRPLDQRVGQRDLAAVGRQRDERSIGQSSVMG